ncbi:MAG: ATPase [Cytophagaceae bacterium]|nr:MAG: ATPase [Cytophagaceae bacterium]
MPDSTSLVPRLTYLRIKNYRALRDVEFRDLTPLTVLIGPNGSGKSTVLDALDFLAEAVRGNLVQAWEKRERFRGMRTQGVDGLIEFEVQIWLGDSHPSLSYKLSIDEADGTVFVSDESLTELTEIGSRIFYLDDAEPNPLRAQGYEDIFRQNIYLHDLTPGYSSSPSSTPFVARMGFFPEQIGSKWPSALAIVKLFRTYRTVYLTGEHSKGISDKGPRELLSANGDNLTNVLYYYQQKHPLLIKKIIEQVQRRIPLLAEINVEETSDERLILRFRDVPFAKPFPARSMSEGTWKLTALLTLLYEPDAEGIVGINEPENALHPRLLYQLAEEVGKATEKRQLVIASHSPFSLDALEPEQVWIVYRGADGYTQVERTADIANVPELVEDGSPLGYLWTSNFFAKGDPLVSPNATRNAH